MARKSPPGPEFRSEINGEMIFPEKEARCSIDRMSDPGEGYFHFQPMIWLRPPYSYDDGGLREFNI
jgi:hypothetical protein